MPEVCIEELILKQKISPSVKSLRNSQLKFLLLWISKESLENLQALTVFNEEFASIKEGFKYWILTL